MQAAEPLGLALLSWLASGLFHAALAALLVRLLPLHTRSLRLAGWLFAWTFVTTALTLAVGLAGALTWPLLGGLAAAGLTLLAAFPSSRAALASELHSAGAAFIDVRRRFSELPLWLRWASLALLFASALRFTVLIWTLPPFVWDSLTYMLTNVAEWTQSGRIGLYNSPVARAYSAANFEVLASWFTVFLHHDLLVEAAGLPAYALTAISVYALSRTIDLGRTAALVGAAAFALTPAVLIAATGTKNDIHMAAYFLFALALVVCLTGRDWTGRESELFSGAIWLGLVLLLAFGTKAYLLHLLPALAIIGLLVLVWRQGWQALPELPGALLRGWRSLSRGGRAAVLALLLIGVFVGGYWNLRNLIVAGNPFYPYTVAVGSSQIAQGVGQTAAVDLGRLLDNLGLFGRHFGDRLEPIRPDLPSVTGWGWIAYGLGLAALAWGLLRRAWLQVLGLGFLTAFLFMMLSTWPTPWNMRYVIWLPALPCLGLGFWWQRLQRAPRGLRSVFTVLLIILGALNFSTTLNYNKAAPGEFAYMLDFSPWSRNAANLHITVPAEYEYALVTVPRHERLGYSTHQDGFIYPLYRADFSQELAYVPLAGDETCAQVAQAMSQRSVSYLFAAPGHSSDAVLQRLQGCAAAGEELREKARGVYVLDQ